MSRRWRQVLSAFAQVGHNSFPSDSHPPPTPPPLPGYSTHPQSWLSVRPRLSPSLDLSPPTPPPSWPPPPPLPSPQTHPPAPPPPGSRFASLAPPPAGLSRLVAHRHCFLGVSSAGFYSARQKHIRGRFWHSVCRREWSLRCQRCRGARIWLWRDGRARRHVAGRG